ncbi:acyl carrier protein [Jatrophihabitans lederbergiae]|uniref:Acyl carrier protein n=1 Tax=Jatrophihabitans lederbergiae TaxID=3075547 RepID=A0ABU2JEM0_9ACTN|nr:acyl carrier protein [Jatrophihabitans sp. DSM 44399]MDT0263447.1 acyl carrier protein [Jatrophihabitans sp. DSM 44399]
MLTSGKADADTEQAVRKTVAELMTAEGHEAVEITAGTSLAEGGLNLSSLELVRLLVGLEERLDIELDDATIMNARFDTVEDLITLVHQAT